jgi:hypothetical protein
MPSSDRDSTVDSNMHATHPYAFWFNGLVARERAVVDEPRRNAPTIRLHYAVK